MRAEEGANACSDVKEVREMSKDFFKEAKEKVKKKLEAEEAALENIPEGETAPESSVVADAPMAETEEVPDEENPSTADAVPLPLGKGGDVENLDGTEAGGDDAALPQSPDGDSSLGEGANIDAEALIAENKAQKEEIENLRKALEQSGELGKEGITAVATGALDGVDFSAFLYGTDEERGKAKENLVTYLLEALKSEAAPILAERDEAERQSGIAKAIKLLSHMEEDFPGYGAKSDAIEALIGRDAVLKAYENPVQARIAAYIMNKGLEAIEKDKTGMSVDELMDLYRKNEEFKMAIEKDRLEKLKSTGEVPVVPMGGSFSQAEPYKAEKKPQTMAEAREKMKKKFFG
ncbi:MAG: hypothetical protein IKU60_03780 [Clostridia bacterium]|nr:hypothetical protein [Clostridia bacterium]